jgi:hypothetical protein
MEREERTLGLANGGVATVCERAGLAGAKAVDVVFISAEVLGDGPAQAGELGSAMALRRNKKERRTHLILYEQCCRLMMSL